MTNPSYAAGPTGRPLLEQAVQAEPDNQEAWAYLAGRDFAQPEDVQAVLPGIVSHRLHPAAREHVHLVAESLELDRVGREHDHGDGRARAQAQGRTGVHGVRHGRCSEGRRACAPCAPKR